jgi:hypothetical protein
MTYGADGKPKYRFATLPDKTVEKRTPEGELVESIPAILDKGRTRSAYSDKIKTDKVKLAPGNSKQVKVVEFIFRKFAEEDWGIRRIAQALNARGEEPPRGRFWLHTSVRSILLNPAYKGALVYGRRSDGKHHWLEIEKKDGRYETRIERKDVPGRTFVHRTEEQCIVVEECHEALVGRELWEKAQAKLRDRKYGKIRGLGVRSTFLLSGDGLMSCAHCGYRFQGDTDRRHRTRRYVDGGYHMGGKGVCRCYMVPAEPLEGWIVDEIQARILDGRARLFASREELEGAIEEALVAGRETASADDSEVKTLEQQLADRKAKVELLLSSVSAENVRLLDEHLGRLRKEIEAIESELRAVLVADRARDIVTRDVKALAKEAAGYIVNLREVLEKGTPDEKKRFIRDFVGSIVVDGEKRQVQVGFFEDEDDGSGAGGLVALARRAAGETAPLWSMAPWGHLAHESALVDRMMTLRHFGAAVAAAMMLSACGKRDPDESASAGEDPTAGLPARFKTDEPVPRPDFTEAAKSQAFQLAIKQAAETLGSQPQPLLSPGENGELTGGVSFQVPHGKLEAILRKAHTDFLARGYYLFRREQEYGHGGKMDQVGLLPTADKYVVMAAMETNGINWEIGTAGVIAWMKELEKEQPFILTGIGFDYLEGHFTRPVKDPQGLAKRMYQFCPDIVDQGVNTLSALAQELKKGTLYFWWD